MFLNKHCAQRVTWVVNHLLPNRAKSRRLLQQTSFQSHGVYESTSNAPHTRRGAHIKDIKASPALWHSILDGTLKSFLQPITGKQAAALETQGLRKTTMDCYALIVQSPKICHDLKEAEENWKRRRKKQQRSGREGPAEPAVATTAGPGGRLASASSLWLDRQFPPEGYVSLALFCKVAPRTRKHV